MHSAEVLSCVPKHEKTVLYIENRCLINKFSSAMSYSAVGRESMLMTQQHILNKVSLNKNTHETRLCIDWLMELL